MKKYVIAFAVVSLLMALLYFAGIITAAMWGGCELICLAVLFLFSRVLSDGSAIVADFCHPCIRRYTCGCYHLIRRLDYGGGKVV